MQINRYRYIDIDMFSNQLGSMAVQVGCVSIAALQQPCYSHETVQLSLIVLVSCAKWMKCVFMPRLHTGASKHTGQGKPTAYRFDWTQDCPLPFRKLPRYTEPAPCSPSLSLSPPLWTLLSCYQLYKLYTLHYVPPSMSLTFSIFYCMSVLSPLIPPQT